MKSGRAAGAFAPVTGGAADDEEDEDDEDEDDEDEDDEDEDDEDEDEDGDGESGEASASFVEEGLSSLGSLSRLVVVEAIVLG